MIRIGMIGCGMAVQRLHFPALKRLRRWVAVVALAASNYERAKAFAAGVKIARVHTTYEELLADSAVDAVLVAVPIELNGRVLLDALHAGKHVMAEKPIAATLDEAYMIVREADGRSQVCLIAENFRYRLDLAQMRSLVDSGAIGNVIAFQLKVNFDVTAAARQPWISRGWRHYGRHAGGFVLDAGVHPIAALREVLGEVSEVYAQTLNSSSLVHGPDSILMQVRMKSGVPGHCFFCYTAKEARENALDFAIFGTEGVLRTGRKLIKVTRGPGRKHESVKTSGRYGEYLRQWQNFCAAIRGEEQIISTARKAFGDLAVVDAALRSSAAGKPCLVNHEFGVTSSGTGAGKSRSALSY